MSKGKKTGGRDWQQGQSGNPDGRPPLPSDIRQARKLNAIEVTKVISKYLRMTTEEIQKACTDPQTPAIELVVAKVLVEAGKTGDQARLNFLFDRTIGKVTEKINVEFPKPTIIKLIGGDESLAVGVNQTSSEDDEGDE